MEYAASSRTELRRHDLIELEPLLRAALARVLSFSSHGLYFPREEIPREAQWLPRERKLLIPLAAFGRMLGVFIAGGVAARGLRPLLPALPGIVELCLENLLLHKRACRDSLTDLATREALLARAVNELEQGRRQHAEDFAGSGPSLPPQRGSMGLLVLRCAGMADLAARHGHAFADALRRELAAAVLAHRPQGMLAARCGEDEFALLLHEAAARTACERAGAALLHGLDAFAGVSPLTEQRIRPRLSIGYAVYPQDIDGEYFLQPYAEQAALLLAKARLAARITEERADADAGLADAPERKALTAYAALLHEGGFIRELLPLSRMVVNLGADAGARPGLRFSIWPPAAPDCPNPRCKGELMLLDADNGASLAELIQLEDPAAMPEPGDGVRLIVETPRPLADWTDEMPAPVPAAGEDLPDENGLSPLQALQARIAATDLPAFRLALLHLAPGAEDPAQERLARLAGLCRARTRPELAARYGTRSVLLLHTGGTVEALAEQYGDALREAGVPQAAVGLASFPYLHFQRGECIRCCAEALDLARLLPAPHVGVFGSLALNISADKHYSKGEIFKAIEEYEWALLADRENANAWNSLGFCMASLSRHHEAQRYFAEALKRRPDDVAIRYNLGMACLSLDRQAAARRHFKACLARRPDHAFTHIRLGQMAAKAGRLSAARRSFLRAAEHEEGAGPAHRMLARLALRGNDSAQAREHLHTALLHNPQDALTLHMLARLYLDCGEDPAVAEMLARQSAALMPELAAAWQELGRALKAQGREAEAAAARARAARG